MTQDVQRKLLDADGEYQGRVAALGRSLIATLTAQRELYIELAALARQQSLYVASGQSEELMKVLAARSRLIDQVAPLDKQLQPYKDRWQGVLESLSGEDRQTVSMLLTQVQQLLADILEQDEHDRQSLVRQKENVAAQITHAAAGAQINRAYGAYGGKTRRMGTMGVA